MNTLAIDIGGTGLKLAVLDAQGSPVGDAVTVPTPRPAVPDAVLAALIGARPAQRFDRVSCGFPGIVVGGVPQNAPNLDPSWAGFPLADVLSAKFGAPARVANDADVQGFGAMEGRGVELVLTLGTGLGSALFVDGRLVPNLELGHHPLRGDRTYEQLLGKAALEADGQDVWRARVDDAVRTTRALFSFRKLFLGGGNARLLTDLPPDVVAVDNKAGLLGGIALWA